MDYLAPEQIVLWDKRMAHEGAEYTTPDPELVKRIIELDAKGRAALDLGCGAGRHLVFLAEQGWYVTGVDWSHSALARAHQTLQESNQQATLVKGDVRRLNFDVATFSLIITTNVLNHGKIADFKRALREIKRVLRIGGTAVFSVPSTLNAPLDANLNWIEEQTLVPADGLEAGIPHHFFTDAELSEACANFREAVIDRVVEPLPPGIAPLHPEHVNEWFWVTLIG